MTALDTLVNPPFANDPPIKINADAKVIGLVIAILAGLAGLIGFLGLLGLLSFGFVLAYSGLFALVFIALAVTLVADVMAVVGGWQMYQGIVAGKRLAIYGLALAFVAELLSTVQLSFGNGLVQLIVLAALYYLVVVSRFPGEQPGGAQSPRV